MNSASSSLPLTGKKIVVTRRPEQAEEFIGYLSEAGADILHYPAVVIGEPASWQECDDAVRHLDRYSAILFTSMNSAEQFFRRAEASGVADHVRRCRLYAVGEATRTVIQRFGGSTEILPETLTGADLARAIARQRIKGERFLFPKGNLAREELPSILAAAGAEVESITVYVTSEPPFNTERRKMMEVIAATADLLTFFSPSSVKYFLRRAPEQAVQRIPAAVIGRTTADAAQAEGLTVALITPRSTSKEFVEAITRYFSPRN